ncbi:MAG: DEAD/DEAH box helicase family protein [Erysipelotrichaceae bacterium]
MQGIKLKEFQIETVNKLLDSTSTGTKKEVLVQAPTGSGKTIILLSYIEEYLRENNKNIFVWLTPGKGDLEEQSRKKMVKFLPSHNTKNIQDVLLQGFEAKDTTFINWETITKKGNNALKEAERKNLYERVHEAHNNGYKFIIIVDEEHLNKTVKAESVIEYMNPEYIVRVSATTKTNKEAEYIAIDELEVINAGLITRALYINENVTNTTTLSNEHEYLLELAINKRKMIKEEYLKLGVQVNPLIIIQAPSKSDDLIKQIETILEEKEYTYDRQNLAIWLSERKENIDDIENNESNQAILIMKQAISTGWDCPRAKILVKLRDNMSEDFETQTIGRIRRMPQTHHYDNVLLDNCFLYTFDEKYEETVKQELGNNATETKIVFLKNEYKNFSLKKITFDNAFDGFDERETFKILHDFYINKYKLTSNKTNNKTILEANGYSFKDTIDNYIIQDKIIKIDSNEIENANRIEVSSVVSTNKNGFELRHSINVISSKISMRYDRTRLMLERMFLRGKLFTKKFIDLSLIEFYAFVINNEDVLKYDFQVAVSQRARKIKLDELKILDWKAPEMDYIKYDPKMKDTTIYEKSIYMNYPNSTSKSKSERMFEYFCENNENIKWFYKNGESSSDYFSVVYVDAVNHKWHFYPDFIVCDENNKIWIIETKGGENASGDSKNIDIKVENKFEALKEYAKKYNVNWGFVRDYDKNESLYLCNTEYTEDMENDNWKLLRKIF